jgi:hypothetical protein
MPDTNNKIPTVSLNKSDICSNNEHPIPYQEINTSSQNIPQTICTISLMNRPQPCCYRDFFDALFLPHFFFRNFSNFSAAIFLSRFFCYYFSVVPFLPHFFLQHFFFHTFPATLFLLQFFSIKNTFPNNLSKKYIFNDIQVCLK